MKNGSVIADAFGLGRVTTLRRATDGMMAQIWRLDTSLGSFSVKVFRSVPDVDALVSRLQVTTNLCEAAGRAGIVTPRPVRTSTGDPVLRLLPEIGTSATYVAVASWLDGTRLDLGRDAGAVGPWLGAAVATVELLPDPPDAPTLDPWLAGWLTKAPSEAQWLAALDDGLRVERPWTELLMKQVPGLVRLGSTVVSPRTDDVTLLHTDLQPKNVMITPSGYALLDWDDAALCSRDLILGRTLVEWFIPGGVQADAVSRFMDSYRSHGGSGVISSISDFSYASASSLNWLYEMVTTDLTSERSTEASGSTVVAALADPLDISALEDMLDLVQAAP